MKKSSFVALVLGTVSGIMFAIGMCMALLPEWDKFKQGIVFGSIGIALGIVTLLVWRKMEHKPPIKFTAKGTVTALITVLGLLSFGVGMCLCMLWDKIIIGTVVEIIGIILLLFLIPFTKGLK